MIVKNKWMHLEMNAFRNVFNYFASLYEGSKMRYTENCWIMGGSTVDKE
jgi:hypothetical protein